MAGQSGQDIFWVFLLYRPPPFRYDISINQNGDMDMTENRITTDLSASFAMHLRLAERSLGTTENFLRHLFARTFYRVCRDAAKPADVLATSAWTPPASTWRPPVRGSAAS